MRAFLAIAMILVASIPTRATGKPSCGKETATGQSTRRLASGLYKISVPSSYSPNTATPLLVALHGDEGKPDYIYSVFRSWQSSVNGAYLLVAPKAPRGGGSWYRATDAHTKFVDEVIADVLQRYNIDQDRMWITGWSGGATFLGGYAIKRQSVFAAVVYHMGSQKTSAKGPVGSCKIPARYVIGSRDFLYKMAKSARADLQARGHETVWIELPGVGHNFQKSTLPDTWTWLKQKTLCNKTSPGSCNGTPPPPPPQPDAQPPAAIDGGWPRADARPSMPPPGRSDLSTGPQIPRRLDAGPSGPGLGPDTLYGGCRLGGDPDAGDAAALLLALLIAGLLRRLPSGERGAPRK